VLKEAQGSARKRKQAFNWRDAEVRLADMLADGYHLVPMVDGSTVVGCVVWTTVEAPDFARLECLGVSVSYRGRGVASHLVRAVQRAVAPTPAQALYLTVTDDNNQAAKRLYDGLVFTESGRSTVFVKHLAVRPR
jgi:ribosomal protein S18 acetylase RimI-like enzyme